MVEFVALVAVLAAVTAPLEAFRAWTRRRLVQRWALEQGFTVLGLRYRFDLFHPNWLVAYRLHIRDRTGHEVSGTAWATGFFRRKVWADWEGEPRFGYPGP